MRGPRLLVAVFVAAALGAVSGEVTRGHRASGSGRPAAVEDVLRAIDADDRAKLSHALDAAGEPARWPAPWADEVALGRVVSSGDFAAVVAFGTGEPRGAARARALLYARDHARDAAMRDRAASELATRYPTSWAATSRREPAR